MKRILPALGLLAVLLIAGRAQATLIDRGGGLIYDNVLNITWLQNANYAIQMNGLVLKKVEFLDVPNS
jgi:hypothetical protein